MYNNCNPGVDFGVTQIESFKAFDTFQLVRTQIKKPVLADLFS